MSLEALELRTAALLVIDMQNAFVHEKGTLGISGVDTKRLASIVPASERLIRRFQAAGVPVIWTVQEHFQDDAVRALKKIGAHTTKRKQISCLAGSWDQEIIEELKPLADVDPSIVIKKHRFGAFYETRLEQLLRMLGTRTLFVTGTTTNACIETTIREAYLRDYDTVAVTDCISGVDPAWEATALEIWDRYFCATADSGEVMDWLDKSSQPRTLGYGHMLLMVDDIDRSVSFYTSHLGFTIRPAKPLADGRPFTAFHQGIALISGRQAGHRQLDHIAFEVNDVRAMRDKLKAADVEFFQDLHDGPYGFTIYIADPDGTKVELYEVGAKAG